MQGHVSCIYCPFKQTQLTSVLDSIRQFPTSAIVAFLVAMLTALLVVRTLSWHRHLTLDSDHGPQRTHTKPTPRVGGIAVFAGVIAGYLMAHAGRQGLLWPLLLSGVPAFAFGLTEDLTKRVSVRARLLATMACGVLGYWLTGLSITDVQVPGVDWLLAFPVISVAFTAFAVGGLANSINIIDGMNGLAAGIVIVILASFAMVCSAMGDVDLMLTCLIMGSAVLGFMLVNWPSGKIFLGDGGAYFLGFSVAWLAVLMLWRHAEVSAWCPMLVCGLPILEVFFSMARRWRRRQNVGAPDALHLHSLVNRRVTRRLMPDASRLMQNSATGLIMCLAGILPAVIAVNWATDTPALVLGFVLCGLLYSSCYARVTQFRWCIRASTLRAASQVVSVSR